MTSAAEDCLGYSTTSWYIDTMIEVKLDLYYFFNLNNEYIIQTFINIIIVFVV